MGQKKVVFVHWRILALGINKGKPSGRLIISWCYRLYCTHCPYYGSRKIGKFSVGSTNHRSLCSSCAATLVKGWNKNGYNVIIYCNCSLNCLPGQINGISELMPHTACGQGVFNVGLMHWVAVSFSYIGKDIKMWRNQPPLKNIQRNHMSAKGFFFIYEPCTLSL